MMNIRDDLLNLVDEKYKDFHKNLCPGINTILGIRVPVLRNYAKELLKNYTIDEILLNLKSQYSEEIMLEGTLIGLDKSENKDINKKLERVEKFVPKIHSWAVCDVSVAGFKFVKKYQKEVWEFINKYLESNEEYEIRFAIVMMLDFYLNDEYVDLVLEKLNGIKSDKYYVQMAVAWTVSICFIKYYEKTKAFLLKSNLDDFTYNKSIQKAIESYRISDNQKEELRNLKK